VCFVCSYRGFVLSVRYLLPQPSLRVCLCVCVWERERVCYWAFVSRSLCCMLLVTTCAIHLFYPTKRKDDKCTENNWLYTCINTENYAIWIFSLGVPLSTLNWVTNLCWRSNSLLCQKRNQYIRGWNKRSMHVRNCCVIQFVQGGWKEIKYVID